MNKREARQATAAWWSHVINSKMGTDQHAAQMCDTCDGYPNAHSECADCLRLYDAQESLRAELQRRGGER